MSFSRKLASEALARLLHKKTPLDQSLANRIGKDLAWSDIAFARRLAETTLRHLGSIDHIIDHCLKSKLPPKTAAVRDYLRIGIAQVLFMEIADHAAVNTTVTLVARDRKREVRGMKNLANAILRRCVRERQPLLDRIEKQAFLDIPAWLWDRWVATYGKDIAGRIAHMHRQEPPLDLTFRSNNDRAVFLNEGNGKTLPNGSVRLARWGKVSGLPGFSEGQFWVQDMAASLAVPLFGPIDGQHVADLCAAPGGKTLQLAAAGAAVTAVDLSAAKCILLQENLARTRLSADVVTSNILDWKPGRLFDHILLDAPCSATGTIRRHPDLPYLKRESDINKLADIQARLLKHVYEILKPGGTLIYCVCSLEREEGEQQISTFLVNEPSAKRKPVLASEIGGLTEAITGAGDVKTLPCYLEESGGMDGFFISRIIKDR